MQWIRYVCYANGLGQQLVQHRIQFTADAWRDNNNQTDNDYGNSKRYWWTAHQHFYIAGIQLEVGDKATPFEHRSFGEELARVRGTFDAQQQPVYQSSADDNFAQQLSWKVHLPCLPV